MIGVIIETIEGLETIYYCEHKVYFSKLQQLKRYMINSTSARILEVLRNVPSVLFIKITLFERQRVCDFYECI